jgi:hypothetical protein
VGRQRRGGSHHSAAAVSGGSDGWGKSTTPQEASLRWVGALGPAREEMGKPVRSGDGEPVMETRAGAAASLPMDRKLVARTICKEGPPFICADTKRGDRMAQPWRVALDHAPGSCA